MCQAREAVGPAVLGIVNLCKIDFCSVIARSERSE
jgi:hypothetical protein